MSPLDPRIPLGYGNAPPVPFNNPFEALLRIQEQKQLQQRQGQEDRLRQQQLDQNQQRIDLEREQVDGIQQEKRTKQQIDETAEQAYALLSSGKPEDTEAVLKALSPRVRVEAEKFVTSFNEIKKARREQAIDHLVEAGKLGQVMNYSEAGGKTILRLMQDVYPDLEKYQPDMSDPEKRKALIDHAAGLRDPHRPDYTINPNDRRMSGRTNQEIASNPVDPKEPASFDAALLAARKDPIETNRLLELRRKSAEAGRDPNAAQGPKPGWQWVTRKNSDGTNEEVYTNQVKPGDRSNNSRVKATEDEKKAAGFHGQMAAAIKILDELEGGLTEQELYQIQTAPQEKLIGMVNRNLLSEGAKRYLRAFEEFTEARIRPVSGAVINDSEYARDRRTYARQYAETPKLAADRTAARLRALETLRKRAGVALDEETPIAGASAGRVSVKGPNGESGTALAGKPLPPGWTKVE